MVGRILSEVTWDATETEHWEVAISIVWLNDAANVHQGLLVLVWLSWVDVMERAWIRWIAIALCVVDCTDKRDLPARAQVVNEAWPGEDCGSIKDELSTSITINGSLATLQSRYSGVEDIDFGSVLNCECLEPDLGVLVSVADL